MYPCMHVEVDPTFLVEIFKLQFSCFFPKRQNPKCLTVFPFNLRKISFFFRSFFVSTTLALDLSN